MLQPNRRQFSFKQSCEAQFLLVHVRLSEVCDVARLVSEIVSKVSASVV